jgi:hypothetical protein
VSFSRVLVLDGSVCLLVGRYRTGVFCEHVGIVWVLFLAPLKYSAAGLIMLIALCNHE